MTLLPAVNSNPQMSAANHGGYYFESLCPGSDQQNPNTVLPHNALMWTDEYTLDRSEYQIDEISWYQGNRSPSEADADRVAVRVGATGSYRTRASSTLASTTARIFPSRRSRRRSISTAPHGDR